MSGSTDTGRVAVFFPANKPGSPSEARARADERDVRRKPMAGFPDQRPFESADAAREYLSGTTIRCLLCGREYRNLGKHLVMSHGWSPAEYKERYNLPMKRGLAGTETRRLTGDAMLRRIASGERFGIPIADCHNRPRSRQSIFARRQLAERNAGRALPVEHWARGVCVECGAEFVSEGLSRANAAAAARRYCSTACAGKVGNRVTALRTGVTP